METMAQFWNCLLSSLPHGQCTETSHLLTFWSHFHHLMGHKTVISKGDPEIGPVSRESYYTSIQSPFFQHCFFLTSARFFCCTPFFPLPSLVSIRCHQCRCYQCFPLCHLVKLILRRWGGLLILIWPVVLARGKEQELQVEERITGDMRNAIPSRSGLSGARERALQCTPVPLLLLLEQSCRKWGSHVCLPCCLSVLLFCVVHFPLSLKLSWKPLICTRPIHIHLDPSQRSPLWADTLMETALLCAGISIFFSFLLSYKLK